MLNVVLLIGLGNLAALAYIIFKNKPQESVDLSKPMREEFAISRKELNQVAKDLRQELTANLNQSRESIDKRIEDLREKNMTE